MGGMNGLLDIWLLVSVVVVGLFLLFKLVKWYFTYKLNRLVIELHQKIMGSSRAEMKEIKKALNNCKGLANPKYIKTAEILLDMNESRLNIKERMR